VNELIKKNEQFLDDFKNSIIQNQENNNHKILLKVNNFCPFFNIVICSLSKSMPTIFHPILILPTSTTDVLPWYLMVACGLWKIVGIDFDKEQITILKNGQKYTLEKIK
jgi:hypothetical protein